MTRRFAILTAFITTATALTAFSAPASAAISCDTATTGGSTFYDGPSASNKYDARFSNTRASPT
ncbi:hypothetical protein [Kribbella sp. NPDC051620]|uniref:hypothetical protein n=1 Tax=Kribbella sp. NPDC051620 TaxID=3364120 RepID=UPI0037B92D1C